MLSISNMYVSHLILYLCCKFHGNIQNNCEDIANLLLGYFNLGHNCEDIANLLLGYFNLGHPVYGICVTACISLFKVMIS